MGKKQNFIAELLALSDGLKPAIVGRVDELSMPSTVDDAQIVMAKFAVNMNNAVLMSLSGLDLTSLHLHSGERNSTLVSALLSRLEVISGEGGTLKIIAPADGATIQPDAEFVCSGDGITDVLVNIASWGEITSTQTEKVWSGQLTDDIAPGNYAATFTATFGDGSTASESVSFAIADSIVSTIPANDTSYMPGDLTKIEITLSDGSAAQNATISVNVFGQTLTMTGSGSKYVQMLADAASIYANYAGENVMTVYNAANKVIGTVKFLLGEEEEAE